MRSLSLAAVALFGATTAVAQTGTPTAAKGVQEPSQLPMLNVVTSQGCFSDSGTLIQKDTPQFNSKGSCAQELCLKLGFKVAATSGANQCWCGNEYPIGDSLVEDKKCNIPCPGIDKEACGGIGFWSVYNTGIEVGVDFAEKYNKTPKATTSSTQGPVKTVTSGPVIVSQEPSDTPEKGGTNVGAIAGGVVVGVVVVAAGVIGMFVYMRRKRNREIEEEHRRNAAVNSFISGKAPSSSGGMSITDSRLDPVLAHRRMSDGSIADNQDYSRKILRVTNA